MMFETYKYQRKGCYERPEVHVANEEQVSSSMKRKVKWNEYPVLVRMKHDEKYEKSQKALSLELLAIEI